MALTAGTLWEIRSGGNDDNGAGFYDRDPGTSVDYSGQDAAQLSLTDLATPGAGSTTLTSVTGGFTAAMAGNVIYIKSGTNFTAGYYEITVYTNTNTVTLDRTPSAAGAGSSGVGKVGGGRLTITDAFLEGVTAGDTIHIKSGTYTLSGAINVLKDGSLANGYITIAGYNVSRGDDPTDDNRPLIVCGANGWTLGDYWFKKNLRFTISHASGVQTGNYGKIRNCKVISDALSGTAVNINTMGCLAEDVEAVHYRGIGIQITNISRIARCYVHDCVDGISIIGGNYSVSIADCVMVDCKDSCINLSTTYAILIHGCTIDECDIGVEGTTLSRADIQNCQITNCGDGVKITSTETVFLDYNNFYNNSTDVDGVSKGSNATAVDPSYTSRTSVTGTTATTSSAVLTDAAADFTDIVDDETFCHITSGTGVTPGIYKITAHNVGADTITLSPDPGDSATGDIVYWVRTARDYEPGAAAGGHGMKEVMADVAI